MTSTGDFAPWHGVFETLRVIDGVPLFVAEHRAELARSMEALGLTTDADFNAAREGLPKLSGRWRWIVTRDETIVMFSEEEPPSAEPVAISVSPVRVGSGNWDARFKTLSYLTHAQAFQTATTPEVVLLNEHGHVASVSRGNIFWRRGDRLFTPAHEAGCRCGIVRGFVLANEKGETGSFPLSHLIGADEIFFAGSVKGIVSVNEVEGRKLTGFSCADRLRESYAKAVAVQLDPP